LGDADLPLDSSGALGASSPSKLVELLARLDPASDNLEQIDLDAIARAIDPGRLRRAEFVSLLEQVDRLAAAGAAVDLATLGAQTFARLIDRASADQLRDVLARPELRARILGEIFRRMQAHLRVEKASEVAASKVAVHWRFTGGSGDDGYDRYETVIDGGHCTTTQDRTHDPRVTITMSPYDFLRLITSNASAPVLFMTGKLKVRGDLAFAASMMGLFDLPRA
jgi:putative sterol carrier protein